jgi:hypothetical protein
MGWGRPKFQVSNCLCSIMLGSFLFDFSSCLHVSVIRDRRVVVWGGGGGVDCRSAEVCLVVELIPGTLLWSRPWVSASPCLRSVADAWYAPLPATRDAKMIGPNMTASVT